MEGSVAKYVAYHVVRSTTGDAVLDELATHRQHVVQFLGDEGRLLKEVIERSSGSGRYLHLKDAVRAARSQDAKLLVTGFRPEIGFLDFKSDDSLCVVDVPAMGRSELRDLLLQRPNGETKRRDTPSRSMSTKAGLAKAKCRGAVLGNPSARSLQPKASRAASAAAEEFRAKLRIRILEDYQDGLTLRAIARKLNSDGVPTARGRAWHASSVRKILTEAKQAPK
jgi:hypothetical protein